ncbi:MAG: type IX secretion system membrane protein PorP/SprF [Bacteroidetes bacterium]|nr:type IX secretion system membrane protein PorP/SprF [Bacteroidota bacterium]
MKKTITKIAIAVAGFTGVATAQQDAQFTQWMQNRVIYNPGYAGTSNAICGVAQYRQQWASFDGAPQSIALGLDARIPGAPVGVGLSVISDKIGAMNTLFLRAAGSYLIPIGEGNLGIGIDAGILQKSISNTWITPEDGKIDNKIPGAYNTGGLNNPDFKKLTYDVGFGAFYNVPDKFFIGLSSTHLPAQALSSGSLGFDMTRHYYLMGGYHIAVNPRNEVIPGIKVRSDLAATNLDVNLMYRWNKMVSVGGSFRTGGYAAALIGFQNMNAKKTLSYKIGYSYDLSLSKIKGYSGGTHEIVLGVCLFLKDKKITSYSDPRFLN